MTYEEIKTAFKGGLIVSCQSESGDPFDSPEGVTLFAKAAVIGGAVGIRSRELAKTKMIVENVNVPVIGLTKDKFPDGFVRITGSFSEVEEILTSGCHIAAIDGTFRKREGLTGPEFISQVKKKFNCLVMADISTLDEGIACAANGADFVSSTLSGYTAETKKIAGAGPDFQLVQELTKVSSAPVIAEGRINSPALAAQLIELGAWAVVVGTAITRPRIITEWYVSKLNNVSERH